MRGGFVMWYPGAMTHVWRGQAAVALLSAAYFVARGKMEAAFIVLCLPLAIPLWAVLRKRS